MYRTYHSSNKIIFFHRPRTQLIKPLPQRQQLQPQRQLFNPAARQPQQQQFNPASQQFSPASQHFNPSGQQFSQASQQFGPSSQQFSPASQQLRQPTRQRPVDTEIFPGLTGNAPRDVATQNAALNGANVAVNTQNGGVVLNFIFLSHLNKALSLVIT